jgi:phosphonopyruvate decarboxylase
MGIALDRPDRNVYCLDGDGALIMHMGTLAIIGSQKLGNYKHIVINNRAHDSVGGQPTVGNQINILAIAKACGYNQAWQVENRDELVQQLRPLHQMQGPALLEIRVKKGARPDLGRPTSTPIENKEKFIQFLNR